jgi:hypothetical protein
MKIEGEVEQIMIAIRFFNPASDASITSVNIFDYNLR